MGRIKFGEVVKRANTKEDRFHTTLLYYVGGEHIDSEDPVVHNCGLIAGSTIGPMFYFGFKKGQILFVSRNPHLRKCAQVDFDGICSEKTFVLETKDDNVLLQQYLAWVMQTDDFWDYCEENKSGSINFFINWSTLADYEFELPDIKEQKRIADLLWSANDLKESYKRLLTASDEMAKSRFIELFGDPEKNPFRWTIAKFDEFASIDAQMTTDYEKYANYPHIGIDSIEKVSGILSGYRTVKEDNVISGKYIFSAKHIIYSKIRPNLNKVALPDFSGLCSADAYPILPKANCSRIYLAFVMRSEFFLKYIVPLSGRSNMPKVNQEQLRGFSMPLPPLDLQNEFASFIEDLDKSKVELLRCIADTDSMIKGLQNQMHRG